MLKSRSDSARIMHVEAWLKDLGLEQYAEAFLENAIDVEVLPDRAVPLRLACAQ